MSRTVLAQKSLSGCEGGKITRWIETRDAAPFAGFKRLDPAEAEASTVSRVDKDAQPEAS